MSCSSCEEGWKELFEKHKDENLDVKPKELEQRGGALL